MSTSGVSGYIPASYTTQNTTSSTTSTSSSSSTSSTSELSQAEFMKILAAQLANQDPMSPMDDTDFIAQMAQFSSLEQMQEMNETMSNSKAYSMIGKNVLGTITESDGTETQVYGEATGVIIQDGTTYLHVGEYLVPASSVSAVYDDNAMDGIVSQASNLIGKTIEAEIPASSDSSESSTVSGVVSAILVKNGLLYAVVDDTEVAVSYITKISDTTASSTDTSDTTDTGDSTTI